MSKDSKHNIEPPDSTHPTKIIVGRHYVGTEKNGNGIQADSRGTEITKKVKEIAENSVN